MKARRQTKILELIKDKRIETQEELLNELRGQGFNVTQATVSRDIKELRLIKIPAGDGNYKYAIAPQKNPIIPSDVLSIFTSSVTSVDYSFNIVVLKTHSGMAQAVCAAFDNVHRPGVVGTIAGDDTIFIATRVEEASLALVTELKRFISSGKV